MGCPLSRPETASLEESCEMASNKAKLQRKMCWSRETPEEIFDISGESSKFQSPEFNFKNFQTVASKKSPPEFL